MDIISFVLGIACVVVIITVIGTVYAFVRVTKLKKEYKEYTTNMSWYLDKAEKDTKDMFDKLSKEISHRIDENMREINQRFDNIYRDFNNRDDETQREMNQQFDTVYRDLTNEIKMVRDHYDRVNQEFQSQLDSRLDKLEHKLTSK